MRAVILYLLEENRRLLESFHDSRFFHLFASLRGAIHFLTVSAKTLERFVTNSIEFRKEGTVGPSL